MNKEDRNTYLAQCREKGWSKAEIFAHLGQEVYDENISMPDFFEMAEIIGFPISVEEEDLVMDSVGFYRVPEVSDKPNMA